MVVLAALTFRGGSAPRGSLRDYVALTKPRIMSLLLLTGVCGMVVGARGMPAPGQLGLMLLGLALACGGASALNHVLDRDIDRLMGPRTASRPVAAGRMTAPRALEFGLALSACSFVLLGSTVNVLTATLALVGNLFYVVVYTGYLKRRGPGNIVLGGAAGAVPPLVGFAAATGNLALPAVWLFLIVFLWTPPHFWSLALLLRDHYAAARVPMLPVVRGEQATLRRIVGYTVVLVAFTAVPFAVGSFGIFYLGACLALGMAFLALTLWLRLPPAGAGRRSFSTRRCSTWRSSSSRLHSTRRSRGLGGPRSTAFHLGAHRERPTGEPVRDRARGRRSGTTPCGSAGTRSRFRSRCEPGDRSGARGARKGRHGRQGSLDDGAGVPGAAAVLTVDYDPPAEWDRDKQLAASIPIEVETAVGAPEPGEEREMSDASPCHPREEPDRFWLTRWLHFVRR